MFLEEQSDLKAAYSVSICFGLTNGMDIKIIAQICKKFVNSKTLTLQETLEYHVIDSTHPLFPWILTYLMFIEIPVSGFKLYPRNPFLCTYLNTLRTGDADLRLYITTVQDGWRKSAFLTRAWFPRTIHLIMQYMEHFSEWPCWRMFIETRVFGDYFLKISVHKSS